MTAPAASVFPPSPGPRITSERRIFLGRGQGRCARSQGLPCWWLELLGAFRAGLHGEADSRPARRVISLPGFYCSGGCDVAKLSPRFPQHPFQPRHGDWCKGRAANGMETQHAQGMAAQMGMLGSYSQENQCCTSKGPAPSPPCTPERSHHDQHREGQPQSPGSFPSTAARQAAQLFLLGLPTQPPGLLLPPQPHRGEHPNPLRRAQGPAQHPQHHTDQLSPPPLPPWAAPRDQHPATGMATPPLHAAPR